MPTVLAVPAVCMELMLAKEGCWRGAGRRARPWLGSAGGGAASLPGVMLSLARPGLECTALPGRASLGVCAGVLLPETGLLVGVEGGLAVVGCGVRSDDLGAPGGSSRL